MTSQKWVSAMVIYNKVLEECGKLQGVSVVKKKKTTSINGQA